MIAFITLVVSRRFFVQRSPALYITVVLLNLKKNTCVIATIIARKCLIYYIYMCTCVDKGITKFHEKRFIGWLHVFQIILSGVSVHMQFKRSDVCVKIEHCENIF